MRVRALSVSELNSLIKGALEAEIGEVWVVGEISNLRVPPSGHLYFTLKDESSQIAVVLFRNYARTLTFEPANGQEVLVRGRVGLYTTRGNLQVYAELVEPRGAGALQLAFEQLKRRLADEGLFDQQLKQPLPSFPRCVGIVTAPRGAAVHDILATLHSRFPRLRVVVRPSLVQGPEAAAEIALGIEDLNRIGGVDVLIVGRGGGSLEDLWPFNEEVVARAIARSRIPVVSAVGHEVDFTIADFVADKRAATPTAAAEMVVPRYEDVAEELDGASDKLSQAIVRKLRESRTLLVVLSGRLQDPRRRLGESSQRMDELAERAAVGVTHLLSRAKERVAGCRARLAGRDPRQVVNRGERELGAVAERLYLAEGHFLGACRERLQALTGRLNSLSPLAVLQRGYSIARSLPSREVVRDARELAGGDLLELIFAKGHALARVEPKSFMRRPLDGRKEGKS